MNENIDLTKILKNCPKGTKLYSTIFANRIPLSEKNVFICRKSIKVYT